MLKLNAIAKVKKILTPSQKETIKSTIECASMAPNYLVDMFRYIRESATINSGTSKEKTRALLIKNYHMIEKGLSLPEPRLGFGTSLLHRVIHFAESYIRRFGIDEVSCHAYNAINSYVEFHKVHELNFPHLDRFLETHRAAVANFNINEGGTRKIQAIDFTEGSKGNFEALTNARCSVRNFSSKQIDDQNILKAIDLIRRTPSVCNRPTTKIYAYSDEERKRNILALQNGNRGFGNTASHVFIVTADLRCFNGSKERNQPFIDGGLTAMSLVYALQSQGIGTCFLNWSVNFPQDAKLKKVAGLPKSAVIITLIAAGHLPEELLVAQSPKISMDDFFELSKN